MNYFAFLCMCVCFEYSCRRCFVVLVLVVVKVLVVAVVVLVIDDWFFISFGSFQIGICNFFHSFLKLVAFIFQLSRLNLLFL